MAIRNEIEPMRIIVVHREFGCDTGCCGHVVEVDGKETGDFDFSHPLTQDIKEYVRNLVTDCCGPEHVKDIDFENCIVSEY